MYKNNCPIGIYSNCKNILIYALSKHPHMLMHAINLLFLESTKIHRKSNYQLIYRISFNRPFARRLNRLNSDLKIQ